MFEFLKGIFSRSRPELEPLDIILMSSNVDVWVLHSRLLEIFPEKNEFEIKGSESLSDRIVIYAPRKRTEDQENRLKQLARDYGINALDGNAFALHAAPPAPAQQQQPQPQQQPAP